jgi:hypothetical protein
MIKSICSINNSTPEIVLSLPEGPPHKLEWKEHRLSTKQSCPAAQDP